MKLVSEAKVTMRHGCTILHSSSQWSLNVVERPNFSKSPKIKGISAYHKNYGICILGWWRCHLLNSCLRGTTVNASIYFDNLQQLNETVCRKRPVCLLQGVWFITKSSAMQYKSDVKTVAFVSFWNSRPSTL